VTWKFGNIGFRIPWCLDFYTWKLQRLYPKKHMGSRAWQTILFVSLIKVLGN